MFSGRKFKRLTLRQHSGAEHTGAFRGVREHSDIGETSSGHGSPRQDSEAFQATLEGYGGGHSIRLSS